MIKFSCKNCGQKLNVEDKHSGKRVKCPKCGSVGIVPDSSDKIKFHCKNCGQSISVPQIHAGKKGKCPKCKNPIAVPSVERKSTEDVGTFSIVCSMCDETIQVPNTSKGQTIECPACGSNIETSSGGIMDESDTASPPTTDEENYEGDSEEYEGSGGMDRRLIFIISGVAAVVVLGLIILVTVILPSGSRKVGRPLVPPRQKVADENLRSQPVTSYTQPTEPIVEEHQKEEILPKEQVSLEDELLGQTKIAFTSGKSKTSDIFIMNADGTELKNLTNNPARDDRPCFSPDGAKIAFTSYRNGERNGEIYVMNTDGSEPINLTNHPSRDYNPSWSGAGDKIAFMSLRDRRPEIYIMNVDGSGQTRITNNEGMNSYPCFSPDGAKIAFTSQRDSEREGAIYIMNADGSELQRLTNNSAQDMQPCFSPDGTKIAFTSNRDGQGNSEIYIMNADGSEQTRLTNNPKWDLAPCWSPDGKMIAFSSNRDLSLDIYVMNADGSGVKRLTYLPASDSFPSWSPFLVSRSLPITTEQSATIRNIDLKLRLKTGEKHRLRLYREYNVSYTVRGQQHDSSDIYTTELEFEVVQVDANSVTSLKVTYLRINAIHKTAQEQSEYDSAKPDTVGDNAFGPIFSAMIGQSFVVKVTPQGEILELNGLNEMYQRMAKPVVEYEDEVVRQSMARTGDAQYEESAKRRIDRLNQKHGSREKRIEAIEEKLMNSPYSSEKYIKEMVGNVIMSFPNVPVGIGDSWHAWAALFSLGDIELDDCTYTLVENKQAAVLVNINSKIEVDEDESIDSENASAGSSRTILSGSCEGSLEIDPSSGWILHKNVTMRCSGEIRSPPDERKPQGTTLPISMESVTTIKPIE